MSDFHSHPEDHSSFFGQLEIKTNPNWPHKNELAHAAGFAEGSLTSDYIYNMWLNERCNVNCDGSVDDDINQFFDEQEAWMKSQIVKYPDCSYWQTVDFIQHQYEGLMDGYNLGFFNRDWRFLSLLF